MRCLRSMGLLYPSLARISLRTCQACYARMVHRVPEQEKEDCTEANHKDPTCSGDDPARMASNVDGTQPGVIYHYFELKEKYPLSSYTFFTDDDVDHICCFIKLAISMSFMALMRW